MHDAAGSAGAMRAARVAARATAVPEAPSATDARSWSRTFDITGGDFVTAEVAVDEAGTQTVTVRTDKPGSLLLHWGVEGGADYRGGWRLPGASARPPATTQYKQRALQSRFLPEEGNAPWQSVRIVLAGDEASDRLNFVVKDEGAGAWYNLNGANFQLPLREAAAQEAPARDAAPALLPADAVPVVPQELAGLWAYRSWERAGCPSRSAAAADAEYGAGIEELVLALRRGAALDELWAVARGEVAYERFADRFGGAAEVESETAAAPEKKKKKEKKKDKQEPALPDIPQHLINTEAYLLWEAAGKPDGADFGPKARETLREQLRQGRTLADLEKALAAPSADKRAGGAELGPSRGGRRIDPLRLVNPPAPAPLLTERRVSAAETPLAPLIAAASSDDRVLWSRVYNLGDGAQLLAVVRGAGEDAPLEVELVSDCEAALVMHWGVRPRGAGHGAWSPPPAALVEGCGARLLSGGGAAELLFSTGPEQGSVQSMDDEELPLQRCRLLVDADSDVAAFAFVLRSADGSRWWRDGGGNFGVPLPGRGGADAAPAGLDGAAARLLSDPVGRAIVEAEASSAWTLMHRFNRASDLLGEILNGAYEDVEGSLARLFVWLRFSAIRQLTWQRNYNTQPRILGAAQERLTHAVAAAYRGTAGASREWARLLLSTVGRGGNAQAVRDEILHIMHRHHIPERAGTWMEQWHQKLHNNTTPDDVPICEAYLAFLRSGGDVGAYWHALSEAGLGRARLESFDRAITAEPHYYGDKRDGLIHDFQHYLGILKAVHSGADLQASAAAAAGVVPDAVKGPLGYVLAHAHDGSGVLALVQAAVEARAELAASGALLRGDRDLLYLDLALEGVARQAAERAAGGPALVGALSDRVVRALGPLADALGAAFGAEDWTVRLFAEEVVRAGPAFAVSLALSAAEPALRRAAELGAWQLVSPGACAGQLVVVDTLHDVRDERYARPTVLLAKRVSGEEEVPVGVVGVLSPDCPDVLSHLAVRARNLHVLLAACHEPGPLAELEAAAGKAVEVASTAAGGVTWDFAASNGANGASTDDDGGKAKQRRVANPKIPKFCGRWVVPMADFAPGVVGAKSKNLAGLRGRLPASIRLPASVTVPFGAFEKALEARENRALAKELRAAVGSVSQDAPGPALARCRDLAARVAVPDALRAQLEAAMREAGIPVPDSEARWEAAFRALRGVWASKYNDRAFYSCRKVGLRFDDVRMAVLCQRVVPAKYAFVIHTANPISGDRDEIYAELVIGLGEAIVSGTVPGSALAFSARKDSIDRPRVLLYPSKSEAMRVAESLIFRSDSNGEDLEGYAGAGLYESITLDPTTQERVDYSDDPIMTDADYRRRILEAVCRAGLEIETALGSAQDIEGVVGPDDVITIVQTRPQV
ncbi:hypothetical protein QBZ16_004470 [Prototheca wickerhamii]|uniref:Pyruvate phosphate dikinase AMP/ATP-binding domain-containing protein n=1 Tax=Prototheca wickerhamii TaxID=3111 RepID=A0AAD9MGW6_PROWI|nr:hypothetical protein QBZ16_004470 [Prototheca wickerhamii]